MDHLDLKINKVLNEMSSAVENYFYEYPPEYHFSPSGIYYQSEGEQIYDSMDNDDLFRAAKSLTEKEGDPTFGFGTKPEAYLGGLPGESGQAIGEYRPSYHTSMFTGRSMTYDDKPYWGHQNGIGGHPNNERTLNQREMLDLDGLNTESNSIAMGSQDHLAREFPGVVWTGSAIQSLSEFLARADYLGIRPFFPKLMEIQSKLYSNPERQGFGAGGKPLTVQEASEVVGILKDAIRRNPEEATRRFFGRELEKLEAAFNVLAG